MTVVKVQVGVRSVGVRDKVRKIKRRINTTVGRDPFKLINNSSRENKENHYRDRGLDM